MAQVGVRFALLECDQAVGALVDQHRDRLGRQGRGDRLEHADRTSSPASCTRGRSPRSVAAPMPESSRTRNRWRAVKYSELKATSSQRSHVIEIALMARSTVLLVRVLDLLLRRHRDELQVRVGVAVREDRPRDLPGEVDLQPDEVTRPGSRERRAPAVFSSTATRSMLPRLPDVAHHRVVHRGPRRGADRATGSSRVALSHSGAVVGAWWRSPRWSEA